MKKYLDTKELMIESIAFGIAILCLFIFIDTLFNSLPVLNDVWK